MSREGLMMRPVWGRSVDGGDFTRREVGCTTGTPRVEYSDSRQRMYWPMKASRLSRQVERRDGKGRAWVDDGG